MAAKSMPQIVLPDINNVLRLLGRVECSYDGKSYRISEWAQRHRDAIDYNQELAQKGTDKADISVLLIFLRDLLVRAMRGEKGEHVFHELQHTIRKKADLNNANYRKALKKAQYRWGERTGCEIISAVVKYFANSLKWDWHCYLQEAEGHKDSNFLSDELLNIKHIGLKLRDLALSNFNRHYAAFDVHLARIPMRIGLLNYGYDLLGDNNIEIGNNPSNIKHYLFLHRLFLKFSEMTGKKYQAVDFDRIFWHFGKTICTSKPQCSHCPIKSICLTGNKR